LPDVVDLHERHGPGCCSWSPAVAATYT
jgi:hypothetical protein